MPGNDLPNLLNLLSIVVAFVIVIRASQTLTEAKNATTELTTVVAKLGELISKASESLRHAAASVEAAQRTVELAAAAQEADRKHRQLEQLRAIGRLVIVIRTRAEGELARMVRDREPITGGQPWRCMEQAQLESELVAVDPALPKCVALIGANQAAEVKAAADAANAELKQVFLALGVPAG